MDNWALFALIGLVLGQAAGEYAAMVRTRTLRRKHKREWTYYAVAIPFKGMIAAAAVEHISSPAQPGELISIRSIPGKAYTKRSDPHSWKAF